MREKKYFIPLIGEFIIIVILAVFSFSNNSNTKCDDKHEVIKDNYIYREEIEYECISNEKGNDSEYIISKNIKTDIKGKIIELKTEHKYIYSNQEKYDLTKETYEVDEVKFEKKFDDEKKMMILTEKEKKDLKQEIIYRVTKVLAKNRSDRKNKN